MKEQRYSLLNMLKIIFIVRYFSPLNHIANKETVTPISLKSPSYLQSESQRSYNEGRAKEHWSHTGAAVEVR